MSPSPAEIKGRIKAAAGVRLSCYELNLSMLTTRPLSYDLCMPGKMKSPPLQSSKWGGLQLSRHGCLQSWSPPTSSTSLGGFTLARPSCMISNNIYKIQDTRYLVDYNIRGGRINSSSLQAQSSCEGSLVVSVSGPAQTSVVRRPRGDQRLWGARRGRGLYQVIPTQPRSRQPAPASPTTTALFARLWTNA